MLGATFELLGNLHGDWTYEDCLRLVFKIIFDKFFFGEWIDSVAFRDNSKMLIVRKNQFEN